MIVTYENKKIEIKKETTVKELLKEEIEKSKYTVVGFIYNNE